MEVLENCKVRSRSRPSPHGILGIDTWPIPNRHRTIASEGSLLFAVSHLLPLQQQLAYALRPPSVGSGAVPCRRASYRAVDTGLSA